MTTYKFAGASAKDARHVFAKIHTNSEQKEHTMTPVELIEEMHEVIDSMVPHVVEMNEKIVAGTTALEEAARRFQELLKKAEELGIGQ